MSRSPPSHPLLERLAKSLCRADDNSVVLPTGSLRSFQVQALKLNSGEELYRLVADGMSLAGYLMEAMGAKATAEALCNTLQPVIEKLYEIMKNDKEGRKVQALARAMSGEAAGTRSQLASGLREGAHGFGIRKG